MSFILQPWQLYVAIIAGWIHQQQQEAIECLRTENRVLRETHGLKRILLNDDQRRRLAVKGNRFIDPSDDVGRSHGDVECREHLGGLLRYYYRAAA